MNFKLNKCSTNKLKICGFLWSLYEKSMYIQTDPKTIETLVFFIRGNIKVSKTYQLDFDISTFLKKFFVWNAVLFINGISLEKKDHKIGSTF